VTVGACVVGLVVAFAATMYVQSLRIAAERDLAAQARAHAELERGRAEEVSTFLVDLFKLSDPEENRGNQVTARELLDSGAKRLQAALQDQPATKAALLATVGAVYDSLGQYQDALPILQESLSLQPASRDESHINTLLELGRARSGAGDLAGAESPLQDALQLSQSEFGPASQDAGHALLELGRLRHHQGRFADAKDLYLRALDILENAQAPATDISALLDDLAQVYAREQQWALAKQTYERALEVDKRILGDEHPRVAMHLHNLAVVAQNMGDPRRAEELYRDAIRRKERAYGIGGSQTADAKINYGSLLQREGRLSEAEPLLRSALAATLTQSGPAHYSVGYARVSLGMLLHDKGDLTEAESEYRQALAIYDESLPRDHQWRASALMYLARLLVDRGKPDEALSLSEQSLSIWAATAAPWNPGAAQAHTIHAYALAHLGRSSEAATELTSAVQTLAGARGVDDPAVRRAQNWLKNAHAEPLHTASAGR
jgi:tetratricopeptide (TPR) repeat protein